MRRVRMPRVSRPPAVDAERRRTPARAAGRVPGAASRGCCCSTSPSTFLDIDQQLQCFRAAARDSGSGRAVHRRHARPEPGARRSARGSSCSAAAPSRATCRSRRAADRATGCALFSSAPAAHSRRRRARLGLLSVTADEARPPRAAWVVRLGDRCSRSRRCCCRSSGRRRSISRACGRGRRPTGRSSCSCACRARCSDCSPARALALGGQRVSDDAARRAGDALHARRVDRRVARRRDRDCARLARRRRCVRRLGGGAGRRRVRARARRSAPRSRQRRRSRRFGLLLAGVATNSVCSALILLVYGLSGMSQSFAISRWLIGSLDAIDYRPLAVFVVVVTVAGWRSIIRQAQALEPGGGGRGVGRRRVAPRAAAAALRATSSGSVLAGSRPSR